MFLYGLTVLYFICSVVIFFSNNVIYRIIFTKMGEECNEAKIDDGKRKLNTYESEQQTIMQTTTGIMLCCLAFEIIKEIFKFFVLLAIARHDPTFISFAFIGISILQFMYSMSKSKNKKDDNKEQTLGDSFLEMAEKLKKPKFSSIIMRVLNLVYFGYAIYIVYFI